MRTVERQLQLVVREMVVHETSHDEKCACSGQRERQLVDCKELPSSQVQKENKGQSCEQKHSAQQVVNDVHAPAGLLGCPLHACHRRDRVGRGQCAWKDERGQMGKFRHKNRSL